jgi:hypothetical protein
MYAIFIGILCFVASARSSSASKRLFAEAELEEDAELKAVLISKAEQKGKSVDVYKTIGGIVVVIGIIGFILLLVTMNQY